MKNIQTEFIRNAVVYLILLLFTVNLLKGQTSSPCTPSIEWKKTLGGSGEDIATSVIQTQDNGFVIAGYSHSNDGDVSSNNGYSDAWIVKLDSSGILVWEKTFGSVSYDYASWQWRRMSVSKQ